MSSDDEREPHRMGPLDVRAQLRLATSGLCSHGVTPEHCLQLHPTEPEEAEA